MDWLPYSYEVYHVKQEEMGILDTSLDLGVTRKARPAAILWRLPARWLAGMLWSLCLQAEWYQAASLEPGGHLSLNSSPWRRITVPWLAVLQCGSLSSASSAELCWNSSGQHVLLPQWDNATPTLLSSVTTSQLKQKLALAPPIHKASAQSPFRGFFCIYLFFFPLHPGGLCRASLPSSLQYTKTFTGIISVDPANLAAGLIEVDTVICFSNKETEA